MIDDPKRIPKTDCKDRVLYRLDSRNLRLGIYRASTGGFLGLRSKWGARFVDEEFHWDQGPPHGTACPEMELPEVLPAEIQNAIDIKESHAAVYAWLVEMDTMYPPR